MKKYIAPELEVEMYTLDASIAAGCSSIGSAKMSDTGYVIKVNQDAVFSADGTATIVADSENIPPEYYTTPNFGNPGVNQQSGGCDCYYSTYSVMVLATS